MLIEWIFLASASFKKLARGMIFFKKINQILERAKKLM